jgi:uracil-DNA glycosylase
MSLNLDTRQRAMLAEMGVRVWWPEQEALESAVAVQTPALTVQAQVVPEAQPTSMPTVGRVLQTALPVQTPVSTLAVEPLPDLSALGWSALRETAQSCQSCTLHGSRKQVVFGAGAHSDEQVQVDWLVVAESPNDEEQTQGQPFVADAGVLLDNMLKACGLSRTAQEGRGRVYVTHATKCSPPGGRNAREDELTQCRAYLDRQIQLLQPRMVLAMGRLAANALLGDTVEQVQAMPLGKLRGQVYAYGSTPVVVTFHPAYVLRSPAEKAKVWADLCLAMGHLKH